MLPPIHLPSFDGGGSTTHGCFQVPQLTVNLGYGEASDYGGRLLAQDLFLQGLLDRCLAIDELVEEEADFSIREHTFFCHFLPIIIGVLSREIINSNLSPREEERVASRNSIFSLIN